MSRTNVLNRPPRTSTGHRGPESAPQVSLQWVVISIGLFLIVWWIAGVSAPDGVVPTPLEVARTLGELIGEPFAGARLPGHVVSSLGRWGTGFGVAVLLGVPIGILFGAVRTVRELLSPIFEFLRYIPPFAWIPLAILWMGAGHMSAAFIVFVAAFPAVVISTQVGVATIDARLPRAARNLGASRPRIIGQVLAPVALPSIFTGIRVAVSNGWMAVVAAEMISGTRGVGFLIVQGQENGSVDIVMAGMVAIGVTGALIDFIVDRLSRRLIPWRKA